MRKLSFALFAVVVTAASGVLQPAQAAPVTIDDPAGDVGIIRAVPAGGHATQDLVKTQISFAGDTLTVQHTLSAVDDAPPPGTTGYIVALGFSIESANMWFYASRSSNGGDTYKVYVEDPNNQGLLAELACGKCKGKFSGKDKTVTMTVPILVLGSAKRFVPGTPEVGPGKASLTNVRGTTASAYETPAGSTYPYTDDTESTEFTF